MQKLVLVLSLLVILGAAHSFKEGGNVKQLTVGDFTQVTGIGSGKLTKNTFGMFYAPWCGHCKKLIPTFDEFADKASEINVVAVDCTVSKAICDQLDVKGYPTLIYFTTENKQYKYTKARTLDALYNFATADFKTEAYADISFSSVTAKVSEGSALTGIQQQVQQLITTLGGPTPFAITVVAALIVLAIVFSLICGGSKKEEEKTTEESSKKTKKRD